MNGAIFATIYKIPSINWKPSDEKTYLRNGYNNIADQRRCGRQGWYTYRAVELQGKIIMRHSQLLEFFHERINFSDDAIPLGDNLVLRNFDFHSPDRSRSGRGKLACDDAEIGENRRFRYHVLMPELMNQAQTIVILLHGFNERSWAKYMPWAAALVKGTGSAVVLFPLAFHMNRAPASWAEPKAMARLSRERKRLLPDVIGSSLVNAIISARMHDKPERFVWSGLETYHDIIDLVEKIKKGEHPAIRHDAGIDFFTYSIGTLLGDILIMTNKAGYFSNSRHASFCGGPVVCGLRPVSKFILDSEAENRLKTCLFGCLADTSTTGKSLKKLLNGRFTVGSVFRSMLLYDVNRECRENNLRALGSRRYAIALADDGVIMPHEVLRTLGGKKKNDIQVDVMQYPYAYRHEDPFPASGAATGEVDVQFQRTFDRICRFLGSRCTP